MQKALPDKTVKRIRRSAHNSLPELDRLLVRFDQLPASS
jgi:hypothetical protein